MHKASKSLPFSSYWKTENTANLKTIAENDSG
jgi:hypothetical protein